MKLATILVAATFICACGTTVKVASLNDSPRQLSEKSAKDVAIYTIIPERKFVEVKLLEARQEVFTNDDIDQVIQKMRETAAQLGCDGVIIRGKSDEYVSSQYGGKQLSGYTGVCIVFIDG